MSNDLFFLLLSSGMVGIGMWMLFCPLGFYQLSKGVYTQEFLNRFETRIGSRAMGLLTALFGLVIGLVILAASVVWALLPLIDR